MSALPIDSSANDAIEVCIIYASETGCTKEYAGRLCCEAFTRCIPYKILSIDQISDVESIQRESAIVVFMCSTTGDGEFPRSMRDFWSYLLQSVHPSTLYAHSSFAIVAFGDSSYEKYNWAGKKLYRRLEQLGARFLVERVDCDEQAPLGHATSFLPFLETFWKSLAKRGVDTAPKRDLFPMVRFTEGCIDKVKEAPLTSLPNNLACPENKIIPVRVSKNERITNTEHFQDVRHLEFEPLTSPQASFPAYNPGDTAILFPSNPPEMVDGILSYFGWDRVADDPVAVDAVLRDEFPFKSLGEESRKQLFTPRALLAHHLDIVKPPSAHFFTILATILGKDGGFEGQDPYALYVEKLKELTIDVDLYLDYVWRCKRTPLEVLQDFPCDLLTGSRQPVCKEWIFDLFPPLLPREYSIASAHNTSSNTIALTAAIVTFKTLPALPPRHGICSRWICTSALPGAHTTISLKPGSWRIPPTPARLLFATGAGIAPIKALLDHLSVVDADTDTRLFFGCRGLEMDWLYREHFEGLQKRGMNLKIYALGSRDKRDDESVGAPPTNNQTKKGRRWIDTLMWSHAHTLRSLYANDVDDVPVVYICGNAKIPPLVKSTLETIIGKELETSSSKLFIEAWG